MAETTVTCVRGSDRTVGHTDPSILYVGRRCAGWPQSIWHNPFLIRDGEYRTTTAAMRWWAANADRVRQELPVQRSSLVRIHREWLATRPDLLARVPELFGRKLACWCGEWEPGQDEIVCHAGTLATLANAWSEQIHERIDDLYCSWKDSASTREMHDWLGLTADQYGAWLQGQGLPDGYRPPGWRGDVAVLLEALGVGAGVTP